MPTDAPINVLVVDDSAFMRRFIGEMVSSDPSLRLIDTARNGIDAMTAIAKHRPRVMTLDLEMPVMDGFCVLEELNRQWNSVPFIGRPPAPAVIAVSSLTQDGSEASMRCLDLGCVDVVAKPEGTLPDRMEAIRFELLSKIKAAAGAPSQYRRPYIPYDKTAPGIRSAAPSSRSHVLSNSVMIIGASTGGPRALQLVVPEIDPNRTGMPIVIVQHMPPKFTESLAARLESMSRYGLKVREARDGDTLQVGTALVAPGGRHLIFDDKGVAHLTDDPPVHGVKPSADVTMISLVNVYGRRCVAAILTGMGRDGAQGMKRIRDSGGRTLAEDESTCVVYGMPKAAIELGAAEQVTPLPDIADSLMKMADQLQ